MCADTEKKLDIMVLGDVHRATMLFPIKPGEKGHDSRRILRDSGSLVLCDTIQAALMEHKEKINYFNYDLKPLEPKDKAALRESLVWFTL